MKVGLSLSRCVCDIFDGKVELDDILVIVARTHFDPEDDDQWNSIWLGYTRRGSWSYPEWVDYKEYEVEFRDICIRLKTTGRLHQPRMFGINPARMPYYWLDTMVTDEDAAPAVKEAFAQYQILAGLAQ